MAYIVNQDIIDRVGNAKAAQLTTDSGSVPSQTVLDEVRESAEGEANGYLARRYATPVDLSAHADLAGTLKGFVLDIAVYRLMSRRPPVGDDARAGRDDAIATLRPTRAFVKVDLPVLGLPTSATVRVRREGGLTIAG